MIPNIKDYCFSIKVNTEKQRCFVQSSYISRASELRYFIKAHTAILLLIGNNILKYIFDFKEFINAGFAIKH